MTNHYFKFHLETVFLKFDSQLIEKVLQLLVGGFSDTKFDIQSEATTAINYFCEYVYERLQKSQNRANKMSEADQAVVQFY